MEYCENGELFHYIVERQRLSEEASSFSAWPLQRFPGRTLPQALRSPEIGEEWTGCSEGASEHTWHTAFPETVVPVRSASLHLYDLSVTGNPTLLSISLASDYDILILSVA